MLRRRTAAAADDVEQSLTGEAAEGAAGVFGSFVIARLAERVGQPGVGVAAQVTVGDLGELPDVGPHRRGSKGAVDPDAQGPCMANRVPAGLGGLARQGSSRGIGDGD